VVQSREKRCRACGYSLQGLPIVYGQCFCPECDAVTRVAPRPGTGLAGGETPRRWAGILAITCAPTTAAMLLLLGALLYDAQHLGWVGLWLVGATILLAPVIACVVLSLRGRKTALCLAVLLWGIVVNVGQVIVLFVVSAFVAARFFRAFG
jgi:hypothetical protein